MSEETERVESAVRVWQMRRDGRTYEYIAEAEGISKSTAHKRFKEALLARIPYAAEEERQLEVERLDSMLEQLTELLPLDPIAVVPVMLRVSKRRAELMGLDAPTKFQGTMRVSEPSLELADVLRDLEAANAETEARVQRGETVSRRRRRSS